MAVAFRCYRHDEWLLIQEVSLNLGHLREAAK